MGTSSLIETSTGAYTSTHLQPLYLDPANGKIVMAPVSLETTGAFGASSGPIGSVIESLRHPSSFTPAHFGANVDVTMNSDLSAVVIGNHDADGSPQCASGSVAIGQNAAHGSQLNPLSVAIGTNAGRDRQSRQAVAIGYSCGRTNQGMQAVSISTNAGYKNQGTGAIAIGTRAGYTDQSDYGVALGYNSAFDSQGYVGVSVGYSCGYNHQGTAAVGIGSWSGYTGQSQYAVAVGNYCGYIDQGEASVSIGTYAGYTGQSKFSVAIGSHAAQSNQNESSVAVGLSAGRTNQSKNSVAIGTSSGRDSQGENSVCIGLNSGVSSAGENSVNLGTYAGVPSYPNSIVINALGANLASAATGSLTVAPIRNVGLDSSHRLFYNDFSREITWGADTSARRYKTNIAPLDAKFAEVLLQLEPRQFNFIRNGQPSIGLIAEEVYQHIPEIVSTSQVTGEIDGLQYELLVAPLIAAVKQLNERVKVLEAR